MIDSTEKPRLIAVVVNWNAAEDTLLCVGSLLSQSLSLEHIIVVDNGSDEDQPLTFESAQPKVILLRTNENLGFAGGYNHGIKAALATQPTHILILNNDTLADPTMVSELLNGSLLTGAGVVSPMIYYFNDPGRVWSSGGDINTCINVPLDAHNRSNPPLSPQKRTFLTGCCLLVTAETIRKVGLFDEAFFLYYEDLDFSKRVSEAGITMAVIPQARLWHKVSTSSGGYLSSNERYWMGRSLIRYTRKHQHLLTAMPTWLHRTVSALHWTIRLLFRGKFAALGAYWRGLYAGLRTSL